ncbi:DUF6969 family protein [Thioclava atlantica]|uniref:DUF6969 domain-containing protein n=1 Tax=Thioclava atlantica TaxID=1317124 RepID=A0A085U070_9RHOB|nr:hypothetical protein [Thioclava atlantica]KFE36367.1 hypothetical protein DW2_03624 [Thioclava atlantica]
MTLKTEATILEDIPIAGLPRGRLEEMHDAAETVLECETVLAKSGMSVVSEVLRGQGDFLTWERYPKGDVFDTETHCHYFYHAHDPREMTEGENGHFHLFMRPDAVIAGLEPWALPGARIPERGQRFTHIGAISVDGRGHALRLFTTNRWVTDECFYRAGDMIRLLEHFSIELAHPNWAVNLWLSGMVTLYRPQLEALLRARDARIEAWMAEHPGSEVLEDRGLQNVTEWVVDPVAQVGAIEDQLDL